jgi:predicted DNA binding CopG/RHH family protein
MSKYDKLTEAAELAQKIGEYMKEIQQDISDYDLSRMLKKVEAEVIDLQHNLSIAVRLMEKG